MHVHTDLHKHFSMALLTMMFVFQSTMLTKLWLCLFFMSDGLLPEDLGFTLVLLLSEIAVRLQSFRSQVCCWFLCCDYAYVFLDKDTINDKFSNTTYLNFGLKGQLVTAVIVVVVFPAYAWIDCTVPVFSSPCSLAMPSSRYSTSLLLESCPMTWSKVLFLSALPHFYSLGLFFLSFFVFPESSQACHTAQSFWSSHLHQFSTRLRCCMFPIHLRSSQKHTTVPLAEQSPSHSGFS